MADDPHEGGRDIRTDDPRAMLPIRTVRALGRLVVMIPSVQAQIATVPLEGGGELLTIRLLSAVGPQGLEFVPTVEEMDELAAELTKAAEAQRAAAAALAAAEIEKARNQ